jgi:hypothetical protein
VDPPPPASIHGAWILFLIVAALLVLFVAVIAVLAIARSLRRRRHRERVGDASPVDPWSEAGRRARPFRDYRR